MHWQPTAQAQHCPAEKIVTVLHKTAADSPSPESSRTGCFAQVASQALIGAHALMVYLLDTSGATLGRRCNLRNSHNSFSSKASLLAPTGPNRTPSLLPTDCCRSLPVSKSTRPHKALPSRSKPAAGRRHNVALLKDFSKGIPGWLTREADPNVGSILSPIHFEAHVQECFA